MNTLCCGEKKVDSDIKKKDDQIVQNNQENIIDKKLNPPCSKCHQCDCNRKNINKKNKNRWCCGEENVNSNKYKIQTDKTIVQNYQEKIIDINLILPCSKCQQCDCNRKNNDQTTQIQSTSKFSEDQDQINNVQTQQQQIGQSQENNNQQNTNNIIQSNPNSGIRDNQIKNDIDVERNGTKEYQGALYVIGKSNKQSSDTISCFYPLRSPSQSSLSSYLSIKDSNKTKQIEQALQDILQNKALPENYVDVIFDKQTLEYDEYTMSIQFKIEQIVYKLYAEYFPYSLFYNKDTASSAQQKQTQFQNQREILSQEKKLNIKQQLVINQDGQFFYYYYPIQ